MIELDLEYKKGDITFIQGRGFFGLYISLDKLSNEEIKKFAKLTDRRRDNSFSLLGYIMKEAYRHPGGCFCFVVKEIQENNTFGNNVTDFNQEGNNLNNTVNRIRRKSHANNTKNDYDDNNTSTASINTSNNYEISLKSNGDESIESQGNSSSVNNTSSNNEVDKKAKDDDSCCGCGGFIIIIIIICIVGC